MYKIERKDVITWKNRNIPNNRRIPTNLKLAILSRVNIKVPTENINWMIKRLLANGTTWPDRLQRKLETIFPNIKVTIELFRNQKPPFSDQMIQNIINEYLRINRLPYLSGFTLVWFIFDHTYENWLEKQLNLNIEMLFKKPRVRQNAKNPKNYKLLVYAHLQTDVLNQFIVPAKIPSPSIPKIKMPPIEGRTSEIAQRSIRVGPGTGASKYGKMVGDDVELSINRKVKLGNHVWYEIELQQQMKYSNGIFPTGQSFWFSGLQWISPESNFFENKSNEPKQLNEFSFEYRSVSWNFFRFQLIAFEKANSSLSLDERITMLRQMSHNESLPFDHTIGIKPGSGKLYKQDRKFNPTEWQMFMDYDSVRMPDGNLIDIHHLMVGLDAFRYPEKSVYIAKIYYGNNWSAATWAGDIGAAVSDMQRKSSAFWEKNNTKSNRRYNYYFSSRAPNRDLLADIDCWGLNQIWRQKKMKTVDEILTSYYNHTLIVNDKTLISARKNSLERFINHYGFKYDPYSNYSRQLDYLYKQVEARNRMYQHILAFANIWNIQADPRKTILGRVKVDKIIAREMTKLFLSWLEKELIINLATV